MGKFPRTESEVTTLATTMIAGLADNVPVYPSPPVTTANLTTLMNNYNAALTSAVAAAAVAETATMAKSAALEELVAALKTDIRYAENTVDFEDDKLKLIGWSGRKAPTPLAAPGQTLLLHVAKQGEGWIILSWTAPADGGKVSAYKVMRRQRPEGPWLDVATAVSTETTLTEQPRGLELEYRIIAVNKAGEGEPSNTEMVVL